MCCVAGASVAIGHLEVNVHFSQERSHLNGETWDEFQLFLDDVSQHVQLLRVWSHGCVKFTCTVFG